MLDMKLLLALGLLGALAAAFAFGPKSDPETMEPAEVPAGSAQLVVGGGCFWCIEALFEDLKGVQFVESGYAGGAKKGVTYDEVCNGNTGHAEVVRIVFDP